MRIEIALTEKQSLADKALETTPILLYGGAKGGGKSYGMRNIFLKRRIMYPGTVGAIFRRTYEQLKDNHIKKMLEEHPQLRNYYHIGDKELQLPNGSRLLFRYCKNEEDVLNYQGQEFDDLGIEECGQWTEYMFKRLLGSNRSSKKGYSVRCLLTGNPGGIGHKWMKRLFIQREFKDLERPDDYAFIQALVDDNPALIENDPDYVHRLESEPNEMLRRAYRHGDWDIFSGQFFENLRREKHLVTPFQIPTHWRRGFALDYGYNHPAAFGAYAIDEDGNVFKTHEIVESGLRPEQLAQKIKALELKIDLIFAGHDCWNKHAGAPSTFERFLDQGLVLRKAAIDRVQGARQMREYLHWDKDKEPQLRFFSTCQKTYDCLTRMVHDPKNVEDVLKVDAEQGDSWTGDDAFDETRYFVMSRPLAAKKPRRGWRDRYDESDKGSRVSWTTV